MQSLMGSPNNFGGWRPRTVSSGLSGQPLASRATGHAPPSPGRVALPSVIDRVCSGLSLTRDTEPLTALAAVRGTGESSSRLSGSSRGNATATSSGSSADGSNTSGGGGGGGPVQQRRRLALSRELPTINWDRWELQLYRRMEEREQRQAHPDSPGEQGQAEAGAGAETGPSSSSSQSSWFADRLAGSDLTAAYFRQWDDPAVHQPMLQDRVLTTAWRDALSAAPLGALEGKVVLDVGCGLGLLSMLAAKAGAARVYAVDGSAGALEAARRIIRANGLEDRITLVHGAVESLTELSGVAPGEVDVIVSNWMGAGLLAGGMLNSLAHAVKTWLRPGGLVLPDRVSLWAAGLEDRDALQEAKDSWGRVAGLDMSAALAQVIKHPRRDVLTRKSQLLSAPQLLTEWRTAELRPDAVLDSTTGCYARCPLKLTAVRDERLFGLLVYWEAHWSFGGALEADGKSPVRFTTHPLASTTHYQQLMLDFPRSVRLAVDDEVRGQVVLRPGSTDPRDLELDVEVAVEVQKEAGQEGAHGGAAPISASYRVSHLV